MKTRPRSVEHRRLFLDDAVMITYDLAFESQNICELGQEDCPKGAPWLLDPMTRIVPDDGKRLADRLLLSPQRLARLRLI